MKQKFNFKRIFFMSILMLLVLFATNSVAIAHNFGEKPIAKREPQQTQETRIITVPGGPGFVSISPRAFQPGTMSTQWAYFDDGEAGIFNELYNPSLVEGAEYFAEVYLPHNATITKVTGYFLVEMPGTIYLHLFRQPLSGRDLELIGYVTSEGVTGHGYKESSVIEYSKVNLQDYVYFLSLGFTPNSGEDVRFTGARIDYDYPSYLPTIDR